MLVNNFYKAFEDKHRGSRELIKSRLDIYKPFLYELKTNFVNPKALDLGCGRGEWLEIVDKIGFRAFGVDLDEGMLSVCKEYGLSVEIKDAISILKEQEDETLSLVSGFHIVEHISFEKLQELITHALRVLKPGGLLILETPNPENIKVATENFYLDPTHIKPIPSQLLSFLMDYKGFKRTKILRLQEPKEIHTKEFATLQSILFDVSPDYSVVGQKSADSQSLSKYDTLFEQNYGMPLEVLTSRFENRIKFIETQANEAKVQANEAKVQANEAKVQANEVLNHYYSVVNSKSWRLTKPLRVVMNVLKYSYRTISSRLLFLSKSNIKSMLKKLLMNIKVILHDHPLLKQNVIKILNYFPKLKIKLQNMKYSGSDSLTSSSSLSPRAHEIYEDLKNTTEQKKSKV